MSTSALEREAFGHHLQTGIFNAVKMMEEQPEASEEQQASYIAATVEKSPKEKQTKVKKKKGICSFFQRICHRDNKVAPLPPQPATDTEDPQPGPSRVTSTPDIVLFDSLYRVGEKLGEGTSGTVFKGTRKSDGKKVAIKCFPKSTVDRYILIPGYSQPLLQEVALNLLVKEPPISPNIVQMLDWFEEADRHILIMEYPHPCMTLDEFMIHNRYQLKEKVTRDLVLQALLAANQCINRGVFHHDIHSCNILVNTKTREIKLIDFGIGLRITNSENKTEAVSETVRSLRFILFQLVNGNPSLSKECQDFMNQCLGTPGETPTLEQLLQHKWFKQEKWWRKLFRR